MDLNPFRTAVPFWGQTSQIPSSLSPKRDCGPRRVKVPVDLVPRTVQKGGYGLRETTDRERSKLLDTGTPKDAANGNKIPIPADEKTVGLTKAFRTAHEFRGHTTRK